MNNGDPLIFFMRVRSIRRQGEDIFSKHRKVYYGGTQRKYGNKKRVLQVGCNLNLS